MRLKLGCGKHIKRGYINLDILNLKGVDVIFDLNKLPKTKTPFSNDFFDEIHAYHIIEHFVNIIPLMNELYRISKDKAIIKVIVPFYHSEHAFRDPTHKSYFSYDSFNHFIKKSSYYYYHGIKTNFEIKELKIIGIRFFPMFLLRKLSKYIPNLVTELRFKLKVLK